jgi:hypothetical protein
VVSGEAVVVSRLAGVASSRAVISAPPTFSAVARTCCSVCLAESAAEAGGLAEVGVVQEPVEGGGGQGLGHELVESIWGAGSS